MTTDPKALNDICLRALLRYFRPDVQTSPFSKPTLGKNDVTSLEVIWALSQTVKELTDCIIGRQRSLSETLVPETVISYGGISGAVSARETLLLQEQTLDPCVIVSEEINPSHVSPANQLVAWVLLHALDSLLVIARHVDVAELPHISERISLLERALRTAPLRDLALNPVCRKKPTHFALRAASKSRQMVYAFALRAFTTLQKLEELDQKTLESVLSNALLSNLEDWQRFEMAACLKISDALSILVGVPFILDLSLSGKRPFAQLGEYSIAWQKSIKPRGQADLNQTELQLRHLAESVGVRPGSLRGDIALMKGPTIVALVECKWFTFEQSYTPAAWDACAQLQQYARDIFPNDEKQVERLLAHSLIVVRTSPDNQMRYRRFDSLGKVNCAHFNDLDTPAIAQWIDSLKLKI
jgi:hypothetical protein